MGDSAPKISKRLQNKAIGDILRALRGESKLSQATVAALAGINRAHLLALEAGRHNPSAYHLAELARVYRLTTAQLFEQIDARALVLWEQRQESARKRKQH